MFQSTTCPFDKIAENPMPRACTRMHISLFLVGLQAACWPPTTQSAAKLAAGPAYLTHSKKESVAHTSLLPRRRNRPRCLPVARHDARVDARLCRPKQPCNCMQCNKHLPCNTYANIFGYSHIVFKKEKIYSVCLTY